MLSSNAQEITIPRDYDHVEIWLGHLDAKGDWKSPAVETVDTKRLWSIQQVYQVP